MKSLPHSPPALAIYCLCVLQIPSPGFPQPLACHLDDLDTVQLEQLAYCLRQWAILSSQRKDNQDIYKRFLFHYSRAQEPTNPVKAGFLPVHPLLRLAAKIARRRMKTVLQRDSRAAAVGFIKKDHAATLGRPFFLYRPRNGRSIKDKAQTERQ
uniref:Neuromedin S n=1 Tax=Oryctolagus cuniculus TaxID=9986 RepID=G1SFH3_RABIT